LTRGERAVVVRAVEAIGEGEVGFGLALLDGLLEDVGPRAGRARCKCGFVAEWPGLLWQHRCPLGRAA
jgi:hypothetical protein